MHSCQNKATVKLRFHNVRIRVRVRNYVRRYVCKFKRFCFHLSAKDIRKNVRKNHKCLVCQNQQTKVDSLPKEIGLGLCQKPKAVGY